jgi:hypothetical protein
MEQQQKEEIAQREYGKSFDEVRRPQRRCERPALSRPTEPRELMPPSPAPPATPAALHQRAARGERRALAPRHGAALAPARWPAARAAAAAAGAAALPQQHRPASPQVGGIYRRDEMGSEGYKEMAKTEYGSKEEREEAKRGSSAEK